MKRLTVGSLFAGIGGFDLGLERAGFEIKWQVEIDPFCRAVLTKHWPEVKRYEDVRHVGSRAWADGIMDDMAAGGCGDAPSCPQSYHGLEPVDAIVGGDPCQANSNAGNVWKRQHEDLGSEFVRVVHQLRPRLVVRENPSKVRDDALWPADRFMDALVGEGYAVLPFRLRSCCLGAEHRRDRVFLLAALLDADGVGLERLDWQRLAEEYAGGTVGDAVRSPRRDALPAPRICRGADRIPSRVDRTRALGNAVDPQIAEWIGRRILEAEGQEVNA